MTPLVAAQENAAMWRNVGNAQKASAWEYRAMHLSGVTPKAPVIRRDVDLRRTATAYEANTTAVLAALDEPRLTHEVAEAAKISRTYASRWLARLEAEGRVVRSGPKHKHIWRRA